MSDISWKSCKVKLSALKPWALNPRQSTKKQAAALLRSWEKFGQVQTVAIGPDNEVYDGHQRLSALLTVHGNGYEVDARRASRPLTDQERRELVATLHAGAVGSWDWDALSSWDAGDLMEWGFDASTLTDWKRDVGALTNLIESEKPEPADAEPAIDRAEELREKWGTERGQLWRIGEHRLLCGDSTAREDVERVMGGERADIGIHDPPYGIDVVGNSAAAIGGAKGFGTIGSTNKVRANVYAPIVGDDRPFDPSGVLIDTPICLLWGANHYSSMLPDSRGWVVWDKKGRDWKDNFSDCEMAWTPFDRPARIYRHTWMGMVQEGEREVRVHPTQKPAALIESIILDWFGEAKIIADYFAGSGPVMVACENLGRRCRAIEISPAYCAVILERMSTAFPGIEIERVDT